MTLMAASWSESSMHANDYGREALTDADVPPYKYLFGVSRLRVESVAYYGDRAYKYSKSVIFWLIS